MIRAIGEAVDRLDPIDAAHQEPLSWSVECSTVVFSLLSAFGQHICSVASEGHCISCGKPLRADILGTCFIRLRQNLSFVIIPLRMACIIAAIAACARMSLNCVWDTLPICLPFSTTQHSAFSLVGAKPIFPMPNAVLPISSIALWLG
jgi:hypothetical protein